MRLSTIQTTAAKETISPPRSADTSRKLDEKGASLKQALDKEYKESM